VNWKWMKAVENKDYEYYDHTQERVNSIIEAAISNNMTVVYPKPNQLLLDIDAEKDYLLLPLKITKIENILDIKLKIKSKIISSSGLPHQHIIIENDQELSPHEQILLQVILGSDYKRELHSLVKLKNNITPYGMLIH